VRIAFRSGTSALICQIDVVSYNFYGSSRIEACRGVAVRGIGKLILVKNVLIV